MFGAKDFLCELFFGALAPRCHLSQNLTLRRKEAIIPGSLSRVWISHLSARPQDFLLSGVDP